MEMTEPDESFVSTADGSGSRRHSRDVLPLDEAAPHKKSQMHTDPNPASHSIAV